MNVLIGILKFNPLSQLSSVFYCSTAPPTQQQYFAVQLVMLCTPLCFLIICVSVLIVTTMRSVRASAQKRYMSSSVRQVERMSGLQRSDMYYEEITKTESLKMWNFSWRLFIWFCICSYPSLSIMLMKSFRCRDLGAAGTYLWADYSSQCHTAAYRSFFVISLLGVVLIPIGLFIVLVTGHK